MARIPSMNRTTDPESGLPEDLARLLAEAVKPTELGAARRDELRRRVLKRAVVEPPPGTRTVRAHEGGWQRFSELIEIRIVRRDHDTNRQTVMFRLQAGAVVPAHDHTQEEECLVLDGEIEIDGHVVRKGDLHIARPGAAHAPITTRTGALLWVSSEIPPEPHSPA